jgi:hypothetical protein
MATAGRPHRPAVHSAVQSVQVRFDASVNEHFMARDFRCNNFTKYKNFSFSQEQAPSIMPMILRSTTGNCYYSKIAAGRLQE